MNLLHQETINQLWETRPGQHASLFMPLETEPDKQAKNRIGLKNLISTLETEVDRRRQDTALLDLVPFSTTLLGDDRAGQQSGKGLALFLHPDYQLTLHLPYAPAEQVVLDRRFYLRPLLPLLDNREGFYMLSLSQKQVQLWAGNRFQFQPVDVPDMPDNLEDALALEDPERQLQFHTASGGGDNRPAMFFGHDQESEKKGALLRYFQQVDKAVSSRLSGEKKPLFLGGVAYLLAIYASTNSYPHLQAEQLTGNLDHTRPAELHRAARDLAETLHRQERQTAWQQYLALQYSGRSATLLADVVPAAAYGRVETLFTVSGREVWGTFDRQTGQVRPDLNGTPGATNGHGDQKDDTPESTADRQALVNLATITTLKQNGTVFAFSAGNLEDKQSHFQQPVAAILRY